MLEATARAEDENGVGPSFPHMPAADMSGPGVRPMRPQALMHEEPATDEVLMSRVRDGDAKALAPLFERHHATLFNFYLRTTGNRAASDDLVQEVFVRILKYGRAYRPEARFLPWMYQIARRARLDYARKRRGEIDWDDGYAPAILPGDAVESGRRRQMLALALLRLPDDKRELLVLSRLQGLRHEAIAQVLGCKPSAVKVRVHRAILELREHVRRIEQGDRS